MAPQNHFYLPDYALPAQAVSPLSHWASLYPVREPVEDVHVRPHSVPSHSAELLRWVSLPTVGSGGLRMMGSVVSLAELASLKLSIH